MNNNRIYQKYKKRLDTFYFLIFLFTIILLFNFFTIQVLFSSSYKDEISIKTKTYKLNKGNRGSIFDRNHNLLAYPIEKCRFWVNSNKNIDKQAVIDLFSKYLDDSLIKKDFFNTKSDRLIIIDDLIVSENQYLINESKSIEYLYHDYYSHRLYPYNELAAQVIGFTNVDNQGRYGIEGYFDHILDGSKSIIEYNKNSRGRTVSSKNSFLPNDGSNIFLTLDINIQDILQTELKKSFLENNARSANGIIINPNNGEIIAMASIPDFNLNEYKKLPLESANDYYTNRVISSPYEPGSTFKVICFSEAIDSDIIKNNSIFFCQNGNYIGNYQKPFRDHDPYDSLTFSDILIYSSNIGTIKIFEELSKKSFYNKMQDFGFGIKSNISLKNESSGDIKNINYYNTNLRDLASAAIGQSILVTNLQMALAYSSIANGGYLLKPKIVKKIVNNQFSNNFDTPVIVRKNLKTKTSKFFISTLNKVINQGTGKKAYIENLSIGGKTGTAEIWDITNNAYSKENYISSFATIFPIDNPKYVMIISVESPEDYDKRWGGETAAPCSKNIIKKIMIYDKKLRVKPYENA